MPIYDEINDTFDAFPSGLLLHPSADQASLVNARIPKIGALITWSWLRRQ